MSKMIDVIKAFVQNHEEIRVVIPGIGEVLAKVESIVDDVVTIAPDQKPKTVLHYTNFIVLRD